jgi:hypothetical protein
MADGRNFARCTNEKQNVELDVAELLAERRREGKKTTITSSQPRGNVRESTPIISESEQILCSHCRKCELKSALF